LLIKPAPAKLIEPDAVAPSDWPRDAVLDIPIDALPIAPRDIAPAAANGSIVATQVEPSGAVPVPTEDSAKKLFLKNAGLPLPPNPAADNVKTVFVAKHQSGDVATHAIGRSVEMPEAELICPARPTALIPSTEATALALVLDAMEVFVASERTVRAALAGLN